MIDYASRPTRLVGQIIDAIIAMLPFLLAGTVAADAPVLVGAASIWFTFYYFLADGLPGGQSLGKRMQGMTVVDADSGMPCSFRQSFIRNLLLALLGPFDWLFIFGERHQRLGDKAAGTIVLNIGS